MSLHPDFSRLIGRQRQQDMLARADRRRLARQFGGVARSLRCAERARRRLRGLPVTIAALSRLPLRHRPAR